MIGRLPERLDPREAARNGLAGRGRVPFAMLERLGALLVEPRGAADVVLAARRDAAGWCVLEGRAAATVEALCQRCLEPAKMMLDAPFQLAAVEDDAQAGCLPGRYEPLYVKDGECVTLARLVEDELLLALPAHVRHPEGQCCAADGADVPLEQARAGHSPRLRRCAGAKARPGSLARDVETAP